MIIMGMFGKIGAIFTTIPTPVIGGMFLVMFGVIMAAGVSNLQVKTVWLMQKLIHQQKLLHLFFYQDSLINSKEQNLFEIFCNIITF